MGKVIVLMSLWRPKFPSSVSVSIKWQYDQKWCHEKSKYRKWLQSRVKVLMFDLFNLIYFSSYWTCKRHSGWLWWKERRRGEEGWRRRGHKGWFCCRKERWLRLWGRSCRVWGGEEGGRADDRAAPEANWREAGRAGQEAGGEAGQGEGGEDPDRDRHRHQARAGEARGGAAQARGGKDQIRGDTAGDEAGLGEGDEEVHRLEEVEPAEHLHAESVEWPEQQQERESQLLQIRKTETTRGGEGETGQGEGRVWGMEEEVPALTGIRNLVL